MKKIIIVIMLVLFGASGFAAQCVGSPTSECPNLNGNKNACLSHFGTNSGCGSAQCNWSSTPYNTCFMATGPTGDCLFGTRNLVDGTGSYHYCNSVTNQTVCNSACGTSIPGQSCGPCKWGANCVGQLGHCNTPEFFGIEFGEMQLSTGIIALLAAIGLPLFLFKRKIDKKNENVRNTIRVKK